jgi:hypothetical protein
MGDTTRYLSAISGPELSDEILNLPDDQLTPEQLERKKRKQRYKQELLLRVYPDSIRRRLLQGNTTSMTPEIEAEHDAIVDAGLYVLAAIEEKKIAPKGGDEVRKLIQWKKKWLALDAARGRQRDPATVPFDAGGPDSENEFTPPDTNPDSDPALVAEVAELCKTFMTRLTIRQRALVQALVQGYDVAAIAVALETTPRLIYGERDRIRLIWREYAKDFTRDEFACILDPLLDTLKEVTPK